MKGIVPIVMDPATQQEAETDYRPPINVALLPLARVRVGLQTEQALKSVNGYLRDEDQPEVAEDEFTSWEQGRLYPTLAQAEALARAYLIPFVALFASQLPKHPIQDFRQPSARKHGFFSYETHRALATFDTYYRFAQRLGNALALTAEDVELPTLPNGAPGRDPEVIGGLVRRILKISDDDQLQWADEDAAADIVQQRIEDAGVFVFGLHLPLDECRGASRWDSDGPPAILINRADAPSARLFTLLHEFVHLVLRRNGSPSVVCDPAGSEQQQEERLANRAAAAALVPVSLLELALPSSVPHVPYGEWPDSLRRKLKRVFRVSHDVIGIRLHHLGRVDSFRASRYFWRRPGAIVRGASLTKLDRYRRRLGERSLSLAQQAVGSDKVAVVELARMLGVPVQDIDRLVRAAR